MLENLNEICHKGLSVRVGNKINKIADTVGLMLNPMARQEGNQLQNIKMFGKIAKL